MPIAAGVTIGAEEALLGFERAQYKRYDKLGEEQITSMKADAKVLVSHLLAATTLFPFPIWTSYHILIYAEAKVFVVTQLKEKWRHYPSRSQRAGRHGPRTTNTSWLPAPG
jgi:hypothetical protein